MSNKSLNTHLHPLVQNRLFPIMMWALLIATIIHFGQHGIYEPMTYPSADFKLYHDWITHKNPPPDFKNFQAPFIAIPYSPLWGIFLAPFAPFSFAVAKELWYFFNLALLLWFVYQ